MKSIQKVNLILIMMTTFNCLVGREDHLDNVSPVGLSGDRGQLIQGDLSPSDALGLKIEGIRELIESARMTGSHAAHHEAEARLEKLIMESDANAELLVLKAILLQHEHHFEEANEYIRLALLHDSGNAQAWLTRYNIALVQGNYHEARFAAAALLNKLPMIVSITAIANVGSLTGKAEQSYRILSESLHAGSTKSEDKAIQVWVHTVCAEIASRLGRTAEAEEHFINAMSIKSPDHYLVHAYADFLLDQKRYYDAYAFLEERQDTPDRRVRLALAQKVLRPGSLTVEQLHEIEDSILGHNESHHHGGVGDHATHARPHVPLPPSRLAARYLLHLEGSVDEALNVALQNWDIQREPRDAEVVLQAAMAANKPAAALPVIAWMQRWKVEDVRLDVLVDELGMQPQS
ncbi:hypothetical protein [Rubellicoccus peritrichatus]|uniref:Tetratricopeptide repeat protein n=1 Tax=Rubellicoccus peritrichatus TaxID=3080537 RepID=A0AAQ3LC42_9BACT|nr:hypothetical protein [Puniceicoccus sp. CR14]WOO39394.1 hypothetical protein RZN69_12285 [Puniceicoccus sp. CR14]